MTRAVAGASCLFIASCMAFGQSAPGTPTFEVASVKPSDPNSHMGADIQTAPGGRLTVINVSLHGIIRRAFGVRADQISGGPVWLTTDDLDIVAKAEGNPSSEQMMAMLRTLLADRFHLQVHHEDKEGNGYALTVAKGGSKLLPPTGDHSQIQHKRPSLDLLFSIVHPYGRRSTMAMLASYLEGALACPIFDRTGLIGEYDFDLEFARDDTHLDVAAAVAQGAVQDQLGLKLEATKGPVPKLVIDHVEKPSAN